MAKAGRHGYCLPADALLPLLRAHPQAGSKPPTFVIFVNDPSLFPEDYKKFIERQLRENIGFPGTPVRLYWRGKQGGWGRGVDIK
jgi:predicted GTPase